VFIREIRVQVFSAFSRRISLSRLFAYLADETKIQNSASRLTSHASRLSTVSDGTYNATYDYLANSPLVSQITFKSNTTVRMTTTKKYDFLNRPVDITSVPSASSAVKFGYQYNDANQRIHRTDSDDSYWSYEYDGLGQVASGKHFWPDETPVAGQQFEYAYDDIGNRRRTKEGGDAYGSGLRTAHYTVNNLNQYTQRDVPGAADIIGIGYPSSSVSVNAQSAYRRGEYYHKELAVNNASAPVWQGVTNQAIYNGQTNTTTGNLLLPKTPQTFWYDNDGNTLSDFVSTNSWDGENRMSAMENTTAVPTAGRFKETWIFDSEGRWVLRIIYSWSGSAYAPQATNRFLWDGKLVVAMLDHNNSLVSSFTRGIESVPHAAGGAGTVLTVNCATNGINFFAFDGNANVAALIDTASGAVSGTYEFDGFGRFVRLTGTSAKANPLAFSTQFADAVSRDTRFLYRDYRPALGRWISRDPVQECGGHNLYAFVRNAPMDYVDTFGLACPEFDLRRLPNTTETISSKSKLKDYCGLKPDGSGLIAAGCSSGELKKKLGPRCCEKPCGSWNIRLRLEFSCRIFMAASSLNPGFYPSPAAALAHEVCHCEDHYKNADAVREKFRTLGPFNTRADCDKALKSAGDPIAIFEAMKKAYNATVHKTDPRFQSGGACFADGGVAP
jgi:RHS repeat-associated protein